MCRYRDPHSHIMGPGSAGTVLPSCAKRSTHIVRYGLHSAGAAQAVSSSIADQASGCSLHTEYSGRSGSRAWSATLSLSTVSQSILRRFRAPKPAVRGRGLAPGFAFKRGTPLFHICGHHAVPQEGGHPRRPAIRASGGTSGCAATAFCATGTAIVRTAALPAGTAAGDPLSSTERQERLGPRAGGSEQSRHLGNRLRERFHGESTHIRKSLLHVKHATLSM